MGQSGGYQEKQSEARLPGTISKQETKMRKEEGGRLWKRSSNVLCVWVGLALREASRQRREQFVLAAEPRGSL